MLGDDTETRSLPLFAPFPTCAYSITPLFPCTNNGGRAVMISGNKSQLVAPGVAQAQLVALVVLHCEKAN